MGSSASEGRFGLTVAWDDEGGAGDGDGDGEGDGRGESVRVVVGVWDRSELLRWRRGAGRAFSFGRSGFENSSSSSVWAMIVSSLNSSVAVKDASSPWSMGSS